MDEWTDGELQRLDEALNRRLAIADTDFGVKSSETIEIMRACIALDREVHRRWGQESAA